MGRSRRTEADGGASGPPSASASERPDRRPLAQQRLTPEEVYGLTNGARRRCRERVEHMRSDGIFTPPSLQGSVQIPGSGGGLNWSGVVIDPVRRILITNATNLAWTVRLFPSAEYREELAADPEGEVRPQDGTPFGMRRSFLTLGTFLDVPCNPPPWGELFAIDLTTGNIRWQTPQGTPTLLGIPVSDAGVPSLGGAIVTAGGLAFIAGTVDGLIRAFDVDSAKELWKRRVPAGGQATPMTYEVDLGNGRRRQFVVIAAVGQGRAKTKIGDFLVAFALPDEGSY